MIKKGLVSIITPCYNGEKLIHRLFDSVLSQDYPQIEMLVVDDGSKDQTRSVVEGYVEAFENKGYTLKYIYQDNAGQAAAINKALPLVEGEYLVWPDADDFFLVDSAISVMARTLASLDESYATVRCWENFIDENTLQVVYQNHPSPSEEHLFEEYFTGKATVAVSGTHMVRMECFDKVNPARQIFDKRYPQNFQMLLPLNYSYKIHTICQTLFGILIRQNSHSRCDETYEQHIDDSQGYKEILDHTFASIAAMSQNDRERCCRLSSIYSLSGKLFYSLKYGKAKEARAYAKEMRELGVPQTKAGKIRLMLVFCPPLLKVFDKLVDRLRK